MLMSAQGVQRLMLLMPPLILVMIRKSAERGGVERKKASTTSSKTLGRSSIGKALTGDKPRARAGNRPAMIPRPRGPTKEGALRVEAKKQQQQPQSEAGLAFLPTIQKSVTSTVSTPPVIAYAVNTHKGLVRKCNEDKISIIQNCLVAGESFHLFGLYDGHGGAKVAELLSKQLSKFIFSSPLFPKDIPAAIKAGFSKAEKHSLNQLLQLHPDRSGSCALIAIITDSVAWVANLGDSRALLFDKDKVTQVTRDHRPDQPTERARIQQHGGHVYQVEFSQTDQMVMGPHRIRPGGLSVSRTIGDICSKLPEFGGLPGPVIAEPDVFKVELGQQEVELFLGCDGIFDGLQNEQIGEELRLARAESEGQSASQQLGQFVDRVMRQCMQSGSQDNLSIILLRLRRKPEVY